jgi:hypothetical protein
MACYSTRASSSDSRRCHSLGQRSECILVDVSLHAVELGLAGRDEVAYVAEVVHELVTLKLATSESPQILSISTIRQLCTSRLAFVSMPQVDSYCELSLRYHARVLEHARVVQTVAY